MFAKIGGGVDDEVGVGAVDMEAAAAAVVFGVGGGADGAVASDAGSAVGPAGAEEGVVEGGGHAVRSFPAFLSMNHFMGRPSQAVKMPRPTKNMQMKPTVSAAMSRRPRLRMPKPLMKPAARELRSMPPVRMRLRVLS